MELENILTHFEDKEVQCVSRLFEKINDKDLYCIDVINPITIEEFQNLNKDIIIHPKTWKEYYELHPMRVSCTLDEFLKVFDVPKSNQDDYITVVKDVYKYYFTL